MNQFLTHDEIINKIDVLFEDEYSTICVKEIMYDLRLGKESYVTPDKNKKELKDGDIIPIKSGQYALLLTKEKLSLPKNIFGLITIKMKYKEKGLVNISGFHVDPGFQGHLVFSVYNLGPSTILLEAGAEIFSILFYEFEKEIPPEFIKDRNITNIPPSTLEPILGKATPSFLELKQKIDGMSTWINIFKVLTLALILQFLMNFASTLK